MAKRIQERVSFWLVFMNCCHVIRWWKVNLKGRWIYWASVPQEHHMNQNHKHDMILNNWFRCINSKGPPKQLLEGHADVEYALESFTISRLFRLSFFQSLFGDSICRKRCSLQWLCHVERNACAWMCIDVSRASEAVIDMNHFFSGSFYGVVPCKECDWNNCSRTQSALNPTWPLKMETAEGHNHTLPNGYRMVLAWIPSQPSLSLVNSIHLHTTYGCNHMQQQGFDYVKYCEIEKYGNYKARAQYGTMLSARMLFFCLRFPIWEGVLKLQLQIQSPQTKLNHVKSSKCCHWTMVIKVSLSRIFRTPILRTWGPASEMPRMLFSSIFSSTCGQWQAAWMILGYICKDIQCVNQNILPTWNKAIWDDYEWFPLLTMIPVRSL